MSTFPAIAGLVACLTEFDGEAGQDEVFLGRDADLRWSER